jgi:hypothetical protein
MIDSSSFDMFLNNRLKLIPDLEEPFLHGSKPFSVIKSVLQAGKKLMFPWFYGYGYTSIFNPIMTGIATK